MEKINVEELNIDYQLKASELLKEQLFLKNNTDSYQISDGIETFDELEDILTLEK